MSQENTGHTDTIAVAAVKAAYTSQMHAALTMLRIAVEKCPDDLWADKSYLNPFWRIAYHALYFTHFYTQPTAEDFTPWEKHQTFLQDLDDHPAPPEIQVLGELPHRPPQTGVPLTKAEMLEYWELCENALDEAIGIIDIASPESGFSWYRIPKLEHLFVALRHLQLHTGQLGERIRTTADVGVGWVGAKGRKPFPE